MSSVGEVDRSYKSVCVSVVRASAQEGGYAALRLWHNYTWNRR